MTVFFRRGFWEYDFQYSSERFNDRCKNEDGTPCKNKTEAKAAEERVKFAAKNVPKQAIAKPGESNFNLAQAFAPLTKEWDRLPDAANKQRYVRELMEHFGAERRIADIDDQDVRNYTSHALGENIRVWQGAQRKIDDPTGKYKVRKKKRSNGTQNHYLKTLRSAFLYCANLRDKGTQELIFKRVPEVQLLDEESRDARPIREDVAIEVQAMVPAHVKEAFVLSLAFGFRLKEAFNLTIAAVDFYNQGIWLKAGETKGKKDAFCHGSPEAMEFVSRLIAQAKERGVRHLISYSKFYRSPVERIPLDFRPMKNPKRAWGTVMRKVMAEHGERWRWHDIRAAFITDVAEKHGSAVAQQRARHKSFATTQRYIAISNKALKDAADTATQRPALAGMMDPKVPSPHQPVASANIVPFSKNRQSPEKSRKKVPEKVALSSRKSAK